MLICVNLQILSDEQLASCPICLDIPVAAKITKCAHVYCWPCILHYLSLSEKAWAKCPICFDAIEEKDLKRYSKPHLVLLLTYRLINVADSNIFLFHPFSFKN